MRTSLRLAAALTLSLLAITTVASGDDDAPVEAPSPPAPEESVEQALPPVKKVDGEPQAFRVSQDGSVLVVGFKTGKESATVWAFASDSVKGRELGRIDGWVRRLTLSPNGKWVLVESLYPDEARGENVRRIEVMNVEDPKLGYELAFSDISAQATEADIRWAYPGRSPDEIALHGREEIRFFDLGEGKVVDTMSRYDFDETALSADGRISATQEIYDVVVNDVETGAEFLRLVSEVPGKSKRIGYRLRGLSGDGAFLVVHARVRDSDKKDWIEGYRVSDGKRRWKAALDTYSWMILVSPTRVAALVNGRVKMLDVENGRSKVAENTSKRVEYLEPGPDGRYFWAATVDGSLIPIR